MIFWEKINDIEFDITTNTIMCLDIEVSSYWIDGTKIIEWDSTLTDDYYNSIDKGCCVYIWQFGIAAEEKDYIFYGREWDDFKKFYDILESRFKKVKEKDKMYIYVHNLSYEFVALLNLFTFDDVFARSVRKPMKCGFKDTEFRCSYMLNRLSLSNWGKQLGIKKLVGDLDYIKIRTPLTHLTKKELAYCEHDILIMLAGLKKYLAKYGTIKKIPLTQTGEVRKVVKDMYKREYGYHQFMTKLLPRDVEEYKIAKQIFSGGDTHANVINVGLVHGDGTLDGGVLSMDETSEYPAVLFRKKYPNSRFTQTIERENFDFEKYIYIFCLRLKNVKAKGTLTFIAKSRTVTVSNGVYDNGRVMKADEIIMYCLGQDFQIIKNIYNCVIEFISVRKAIAGYLDKKYVEYILQLFKDKSTLKGVKGQEDFYLQQKQFLNSLYGMQVMDPVQPKISFNNNEWSARANTDDDIKATLEELHEKKYKNYLSYFHGCCVTAWARLDLWTMIDRIVKDGGSNDIIYYDTDSLKIKNYKKYVNLFEERNKEIIKENKEASKFHKIADNWKQKTNDGKETILGTWAFDGIALRFKTLGAKKYLAEYEDGLHITVSGVPKNAVKALKNFDDFEDGFKFPADECKKGLATYLGEEVANPSIIMPDGYIVNQPYGINIRNIGYTLGLTEEFTNIIDVMRERGEI